MTREPDDDDLETDPSRWIYMRWNPSWRFVFGFIATFAIFATLGMEIAKLFGYASDTGAFDVVIPLAAFLTLIAGFFLRRI